MGYRTRPRDGFTLIELLVVIAIIAILAAVLFPVFSRARQSAVQTQCLAHGKEIGTAIRMYVDDANGKWPPLQGFNEKPPAGQPGHIGPELTLEPYTKAKQLFRCPADNGGPSSGGQTYYARYGQSFSLSSQCFSHIPAVSVVNDQDVTDPSGWFGFAVHILSDSEFEYPSNTRIVREIMLPWFGSDEKYAQKSFYSKWHSNGGTIVFADGHAKFMTSASEYDETAYTPSGALTKANPAGSW